MAATTMSKCSESRCLKRTLPVTVVLRASVCVNRKYKPDCLSVFLALRYVPELRVLELRRIKRLRADRISPLVRLVACRVHYRIAGETVARLFVEVLHWPLLLLALFFLRLLLLQHLLGYLLRLLGRLLELLFLQVLLLGVLLVLLLL